MLLEYKGTNSAYIKVTEKEYDLIIKLIKKRIIDMEEVVNLQSTLSIVRKRIRKNIIFYRKMLDKLEKYKDLFIEFDK